ncbi:MAG: DNA repair protein RecO (recombination protein O) [Bacteroidia bacterium]|jgi:DNA repair protein RecO (recombination protein O)
MLVSTKAILLHSLKYSDNSVIAKVYTESHGMLPFMVNVGKGKRSASKAVLLQPLTLLEIGFNPESKGGIKRPSSLERAEMTMSITIDTIKTTLALFMAEMVLKSIQEEERNASLFNFLWRAVQSLNLDDQSLSNFHLKFLIELSGHLGFYPDGASYTSGSLFNLIEGRYDLGAKLSQHYLDPETSDLLNDLVQASFSNHHSIEMTTRDRRTLLSSLIDYYRLHLDGMKEIKSHQILQEVLA